MKMKTVINILILLITVTHSFGQVDDGSKRKVVLEKNITDSLFIFGEWNETDSTETHLRYLGTIQAGKENYKIMTSCWLWGLSKRATNRILLFSEDNELIGNYYLSMSYDLPEKIENNQIVFLHSESDDCDKTVITRLSFEKGIPKEFFLECKNGHGEIYVFDRE
jgi:hypothetical protein